MSITLSILIVNWNTRDLLRECLRSIQSSNFQESMEVIVVDNASTDGSAEMVQSEFANFMLTDSGKNLGYAGGNNLAFQQATGEFLLTLNPDTVLESDTLSTAVSAMRANPSMAVLGAMLIGTEGEVQSSVRGFPSYVGILGDMLGIGKILPGSRFNSYRMSGFNYESAQVAPQPMGTFLMFRRSALAKIGDPLKPMDERFPIFFNEVDLLKRLKDANLDTWYDPSVRLRHLGGASTRQVRKSMIWESHMSLIRYMRKHELKWWNSPVFILFSILVWLGALVRAKGIHGGFRP